MNKHTVLAITMAFAIAVIAMASIPEESDAATVTLDSETIGNYLNEETHQYEFSEGDYVLSEKFGPYDNQITHPMVFSGTCTLDLNGFGIFPTENVQYGIINQGVLTVKDSSEDKTGSIALSYYLSSSMGVAILNEGSLTVDGGSFTADYSIMNSASHTDTELVVNDVWALSSTQAIRVCSGSVEINGGDITDGHDYGIAIIGDASEGFISVEVNGGDINIINGPDEMLICGLIMGAQGCIGSTYNVMPEWFVAEYDAAMKGDWETARQIQYKINRVIDVLLRYSENGAIKGVKAAMTCKGFDMGNAVYPSKVYTASELASLKAELSALGIQF